MKSELGLVINEDLERIPHELEADWSSGLGEGCAEHHNLLLHRSGLEDILDITTHIWRY